VHKSLRKRAPASPSRPAPSLIGGGSTYEARRWYSAGSHQEDAMLAEHGRPNVTRSLKAAPNANEPREPVPVIDQKEL